MLVLGWFGFLVLVTATGAMAGSFAWSIGSSHGPLWAWIAAAGAASLLVTETVLAAGRGANPWLRWPALVVAMLAVASLEVGFAGSAFTDARAARAADVKHARREAATEPASVLRVRLEAVEARHPGVSAAWCSARSTGAREACNRWLDAREALAGAEDAERRGPARATGDADARAALLARRFGGEESAWADTLVLLLAAAMSLARAAAASLLLGGRADAAVRVAAHVEVAAPAPAPVEASTPAPVEAATPNLPEPARRVLRVVEAKAQPAPAGQLGYVGFVPPGELSQRRIAEAAGMSRRAAIDGLQRLEAAGVVQMRVVGRDGTEIKILRAAG